MDMLQPAALDLCRVKTRGCWVSYYHCGRACRGASITWAHPGANSQEDKHPIARTSPG